MCSRAAVLGSAFRERERESSGRSEAGAGGRRPGTRAVPLWKPGPNRAFVRRQENTPVKPNPRSLLLFPYCGKTPAGAWSALPGKSSCPHVLHMICNVPKLLPKEKPSQSPHFMFYPNCKTSFFKTTTFFSNSKCTVTGILNKYLFIHNLDKV